MKKDILEKANDIHRQMEEIIKILEIKDGTLCTMQFGPFGKSFNTYIHSRTLNNYMLSLLKPKLKEYYNELKEQLEEL